VELWVDEAGDQPVHVVCMDSGENWIDAAWIAEMQAALDRVEGTDGPTALVVTGAGKHFCNGVDITNLHARPPAEINALFAALFELCARLLTFPMRTVAAINGHAFGGGAMIAMCFDRRVMRADRGWWCIPEADLGVPLHPLMSAVLQARLPIATAHAAITTAHRYTASEAQAASVVDEAVDEAEVVTMAVKLARAGATKLREAQGALKSELYRDLLSSLRDPPVLF
jgi:enoyl-CoA hydratase/carnithine racemase